MVLLSFVFGSISLAGAAIIIVSWILTGCPMGLAPALSLVLLGAALGWCSAPLARSCDARRHACAREELPIAGARPVACPLRAHAGRGASVGARTEVL